MPRSTLGIEPSIPISSTPFRDAWEKPKEFPRCGSRGHNRPGGSSVMRVERMITIASICDFALDLAGSPALLLPVPGQWRAERLEIAHSKGEDSSRRESRGLVGLRSSWRVGAEVGDATQPWTTRETRWGSPRLQTQGGPWSVEGKTRRTREGLCTKRFKPGRLRRPWPREVQSSPGAGFYERAGREGEQPCHHGRKR